MSFPSRRIARTLVLGLVAGGTFAYPLANLAGAAVSMSVRTAGGSLRVRAAATIASQQVGMVANGAHLSLGCSVTGEYVHGTVRSTTLWDWMIGGGFVSHAYISGSTLPSCATQAHAAVQFALAQRGKAYVFGATGPNTFDCSGLVQAAWAAAGVTIPRTTYQQVKVGAAVPGPSFMKPGDLIFIPGSDGTMANPGHVGMFIGPGADGQPALVQAPSTGDVVKIIPVSGWTSKIAAIRRLAG